VDISPALSEMGLRGGGGGGGEGLNFYKTHTPLEATSP